MTKKKAGRIVNKTFTTQMERINKVIERLESEVEKTLGSFVQKGEESSRVLKKNFDEILEKISTTELYTMASEKTEGLQKEVRKLADEVVARLKNFDLRVASSIFSDVRVNVEQMIEKIQAAGILETAKAKANDTKNQVLHALNIPSLEEVSRLDRKLTSLERKINTLSRTAKKKQAA